MKKIILFAGLTALFVAGCGSGSETPPADKPEATTGATTGATATTEPKTDATGGTGFTAVQAVFTAKCAGCHGATNPKDGIDLTTYEGAMKGSPKGPVIVAGDPASSLLVKAIKGEPGAKKMPPGPPLDPAQVKTIEDWVKDGAKA